jgi:signal transduction histidine kinase
MSTLSRPKSKTTRDGSDQGSSLKEGRTGSTATVDDEIIVGVVGISMEVTELKKKEEENMEQLVAEAAAKEANKMKSGFLANMSHEIQAPITGIIGTSELIMDTALNEEQNEKIRQRASDGNKRYFGLLKD